MPRTVVTPYPPFLTAMANPSDIPIMLHEMATIGTAMPTVAVFTWLTIAHLIPKIVVVKEMKRIEKPLTRL